MMDTIQEIFNNREIAIGIWAILTIVVLLFTRPARQFLRTVIPILFCRKFVVFYIVFISFLCAILYMLHWAKLWNSELLKDTIFWVLIVELPLFTKAIEKADGSHFFSELIKENIAVAVLIEFFIGFWTFSLAWELALVPISILISAIYAIAERDKKHHSIKRFISGLMVVWGFILIINAITGLVRTPEQFLNIDTLKSLLLPLVLLILNLPVVYGLALYNMYEQVFIRIKGNIKEQRKMKLQVLMFAGVNLSKISAIRKSLPETIVSCRTAKDLRINLDKVRRRLNLRIGDNYMKRSRYYIVACIIGFMISLFGLILANSEVSLKELVTLDFVIDVPRIKEILTYIFSTMIVLSVTLLFFAISFNKKQGEDISQIKKFALYELLLSSKHQESQLMEYPPIEDQSALYNAYVLNSYQIRSSCDKVLASYDNLLTTWEHESVTALQLSAMVLSDDFGINAENVDEYSFARFSDYYNDKVKTASQSENFNTYTNMVKTDIEKYSMRVKQFTDDFKKYYK